MLADIGIRSQACTRGCASKRILEPSKLHISFASHRISNRTCLPRSVSAAIKARNSDEEQELIRQEGIVAHFSLFLWTFNVSKLFDEHRAFTSICYPNICSTHWLHAHD